MSELTPDLSFMLSCVKERNDEMEYRWCNGFPCEMDVIPRTKLYETPMFMWQDYVEKTLWEWACLDKRSKRHCGSGHA